MFYKKILTFVKEDQADRAMIRKKLPPSKKMLLWLKRRDEQRLKDICKLGAQNYHKFSKKTLFNVALIMTHALPLEHQLVAGVIADRSYSLGFKRADKLRKITADRILVSKYQKQKYGTQQQYLNGKFIPYPVSHKLKDPLIELTPEEKEVIVGKAFSV